MQNIIQITNLSKRYRITKSGKAYQTFRETLLNFYKSNPKIDFWALKDISFEVKQGDSVAIIGRNGAGKSTLLKILSRITLPTTGQIIANGRIASLLEVGTGFHPELTGRENVFLNGSILGLKRHEIIRNFEAIVAFAGVEQFIDTPLKHYSSGMQLRLAFSVAAHLEPEILIIDEVLAVGDSAFQQKCMNLMTDISRSGRTILFVSHNIAAIKQLCKSGIVLEQGKKAFEGTAAACIEYYQSALKIRGKSIDLKALPRTDYGGGLLFAHLNLIQDPIPFGTPIMLKIQLHSRILHTYKDLDFGINIADRSGYYLYHLSNRFLNITVHHDDDTRTYAFRCENNLKPGLYLLTLFLRAEDKLQDWLPDAIEIEIAEGSPYPFSQPDRIQGGVLPNFSFEIF